MNKESKIMIGTKFRKAAIAAVIAVTAAFSSPASAKEIFEDLCGDSQVECTYISGRFAHNQKLWRSLSGRHAMNLSQGFSRMYLYECYSMESVSKAHKLLDEYLSKDKNMEMVMKQEQGFQQYRVYEQFGKDGKIYKMIIWSAEADNLCEVVVIDWDEGLTHGEQYSMK